MPMRTKNHKDEDGIRCRRSITRRENKALVMLFSRQKFGGCVNNRHTSSAVPQHLTAKRSPDADEDEELQRQQRHQMQEKHH